MPKPRRLRPLAARAQLLGLSAGSPRLRGILLGKDGARSISVDHYGGYTLVDADRSWTLAGDVTASRDRAHRCRPSSSRRSLRHTREGRRPGSCRASGRVDGLFNKRPARRPSRCRGRLPSETCVSPGHCGRPIGRGNDPRIFLATNCLLLNAHDCVSGANGTRKGVYATASHSAKASATSIASRTEAPVP